MTLFEGIYHLGVCALVNSLIGAGFTGRVVVGHRGALPTWITSLPLLDDQPFNERTPAAVTRRATSTVSLTTVALETEFHSLGS